MSLAEWESIVREHGPMAFDTAWRILGHVADTEDAVQEALLAAFRINQERDVNNWGGLLRVLAARRAIDRLKKRCDVELRESEPLTTADMQPEAVAIERELAAQLRLAIGGLPDREATVFSLHYYSAMSNREIAAELKITVGAVAAALHKARTKLKKSLSSEGSNDRTER